MLTILFLSASNFWWDHLLIILINRAPVVKPLLTGRMTSGESSPGRRMNGTNSTRSSFSQLQIVTR